MKKLASIRVGAEGKEKEMCIGPATFLGNNGRVLWRQAGARDKREREKKYTRQSINVRETEVISAVAETC